MEVTTMCLGALPAKYGDRLNCVLYPRLDQVTALLASDKMYPDHIPSVNREGVMIIVVPQRPVNYEFAVMLNKDLCVQYGGTPGLRSETGLRYALAIPEMTVFGQYAYPELAFSAAHMIQSIACGHVFTDGNKRTAWHIASLFCASNGYLLEPEYPKDGRDAILALCTGQFSVEDLGYWVDENLFER